MITVESTKLAQMYLQRKKENQTYDLDKDVIENLASSVLIDLELEKIASFLEYVEDCCY
ncbi:MAG: hypothetical protein K8Q99_02050 [Acholeplasmataceae bacterium]|nr:hypothetical protein [Acholeplasmataceae bacterium]MCD4826548.1 hypothetical protein [Acholeplasmataceae bacterium]